MVCVSSGVGVNRRFQETQGTVCLVFITLLHDKFALFIRVLNTGKHGENLKKASHNTWSIDTFFLHGTASF